MNSPLSLVTAQIEDRKVTGPDRLPPEKLDSGQTADFIKAYITIICLGWWDWWVDEI